ncbi:MAG: 2-oxoglutarate dehydrogenase E1 component [Polyangiaceae bacterium]|nr:2-oxoglutarate dehydrogenase E1 component [Polyangiaceae bacterium]
MTRMEDLPSLSLAFVEGLYSEYCRDPNRVPEAWRTYFEALGSNDARPQQFKLAPSFRRPRLFDPSGYAGGLRSDLARVVSRADAVLQDRVDELVRAYRVSGHRIAAVDPLGLARPSVPELEPEFYGLGEADMDRELSAPSLRGSAAHTPRQVLDWLRTTYCCSIGAQFMHIDGAAIKGWMQERLEGSQHRVRLSHDQQLGILTKLTDAVIFEEFIQRKFLGAKSFSLEGSESLIPLLAIAIDRAAELDVNEIVLGMAHRGRLNVLANIMGKSAREIFREFEDSDPEKYLGSGDVKYHLGYSSDVATSSGRTVHLSLCFNPSHLEFVDPVALGRVRAKQDRGGDTQREHKLGLLIHGDAAFIGEGVVQETLGMSELRAYTTGGTIHVIVNNQIGFTTPPSEGRSSLYATSVARMLQIPIFHVNGEDPEAVAQVVQLAMDFRQRFRRDVVIDMYGYRRHGHNEGDEPAFTQPLLYATISARRSVRDGYLTHLLRLGEVTEQEGDRIAIERREQLERELSEARNTEFAAPPQSLDGYWRGYRGGSEGDVPDIDTGVDRSRLVEMLEQLARVPQDFHAHKKIRRLLDQRREMACCDRPLDWGAAEHLAFASLAVTGIRVRLSGQDSARGTFSHRHAVLHDVEDGHTFMPLRHVSSEQASVDIYNSPLSEAGVLGFEYGYSLDSPEVLVLWEAQFGDFVNAAQVIIDQFIVSAEDKWKRLSGLVLLLPHGYEGMGPEHSSARIERFLQLGAEHNLQLVQPSTPAQFFHVLRRQALRKWRKPLVVFTPKGLLRHPKCTSELADFATGRFMRVLVDPLDRGRSGDRVERVLLCTGKVYYALEQQREELRRHEIAIVRLEQLYPLPEQALAAALGAYRDGTPVVWVQEEPENMGAWRHLRAHFGTTLFDRFPFSHAARAESASPATGSASSHKLEQRQLMDQAFAADGGGRVT